MSDEIDVITNKKRNKVIHFAHKKITTSQI